MDNSFFPSSAFWGRRGKELLYAFLAATALQLCITLVAFAEPVSQQSIQVTDAPENFRGDPQYTDFIFARPSGRSAARGVAASIPSLLSGETIDGIPIAAVYQPVPEPSSRTAAISAEKRPDLCVPGPKAKARAVQSQRSGSPPCPFDGLTVVRLANAVTAEKAALIKASLESATGAAVTVVPMASPQVTPNDPLFTSGSQLHIPKVSLPQAWDISQGSSAIIIAVVDSGVKRTHRDLEARLLPGYDFYSHDSDLTDFTGHGTGVAGVLGAISNNGLGAAGVDWNSRLLPVKVFPDGFGQAPYTAIAEGIVYATDQGADVINLSLGGAVDNEMIKNAVEYALGFGVVVVAAAGNSSTSEPFYPASYPGVISVAAVDFDDKKAIFSSFGSKIDIAAPGRSITSIPFDERYGSTNYSGTSFAAPIVSGVAGLLLGRDPSASLLDIRGAILTGVDDISEANPLYASLLGSGRLNALKSLQATPRSAVKLSGMVSDAPFGNNSGVIDRGERIEVQVAVDSLWLPTGTFNLSVSSGSEALSPVGAESVTISTLNGGETGTATFLFDVGAQAPYNSLLPIHLTATGASFEKTVTIPVLVEFPVMSGWTPYPAGAKQPYAGEPAFLDVNGDGELELGFANNCNDQVSVLDKNGSALSPWPQSGMYGIYTPLAWGDITGDGIPDIISGAGAGHPDDPARYPRISAQQMDGALLPGFPRILNPVATGLLNWSNPPGLIPYPGTNAQKVLFAESLPQSEGQFRGTIIHMLNGEGSEVNGWPKDEARALSDGRAPFSQGDINGDGVREFAVQYSNLHLNPGRDPSQDESVGPLVVYGVDGTVRLTLNQRGYFGVPCKATLAAPVFADVNGDGKDEIFTYSECGAQLWDGEGNFMPGFPSINGLPSPENTGPTQVWYRAYQEPPTVADLENDGELDFVWTFAKVDRDSGGFTRAVRYYLAAMNPNGAMKPGFPVEYDRHEKGTVTAAQPRLIDVDGDGKLEILITATGNENEHSMQGFRYTGAVLENFPVRFGLVGSSSLAVSDLNNDGRFDYVTEPLDMKNVLVRSLPFEYRASGHLVDPSQLLWWNHRFANPARTNYRPISGSVIGAPVPTPVVPTPTVSPTQQPPAPLVKRRGARLEVRMKEGSRSYQIQLVTRGTGTRRTVTASSARVTISIGRQRISEVRYRMRMSRAWSSWSSSTSVR